MYMRINQYVGLAIYKYISKYYRILMIKLVSFIVIDTNFLFGSRQTLADFFKNSVNARFR